MKALTLIVVLLYHDLIYLLYDTICPQSSCMISFATSTMINDFTQNFQDIMSQERAQKQLFELWMERGELDE